VSEDLGRLGLSLAETCRGALDAAPPIAAKAVALEVSPRLVPVKKTMLDWLLFRSQATVRQRLLGDDDAPPRAIPPRVKQRPRGPRRAAARPPRAGFRRDDGARR